MDFVTLYPLGIKTVFFGASAWNASNGRPHGFTPYRCFTFREIDENVVYFYAKAEEWRRRQALSCGSEFKPEKFDPKSLEAVRERDGCLDPMTVSVVLRDFLDKEFQKAARQCRR
jgi:hypothetical protein